MLVLLIGVITIKTNAQAKMIRMLKKFLMA